MKKKSSGIKRPQLDHGKSGMAQVKKVKVSAEELNSCVHDRTKNPLARYQAQEK